MKQVVFLSVLSLFLFTGCHGVGGGIRVDAGFPHSHHAPPSHAPAYGRRSLHRYHYYPNAEFYFDVGRNMYFYLDSRGRWSFSVNLPLHLRSHLYNGYVEIEMENDRPYLRHEYHKNKYNKSKYKSKLRYKNGKVYKSKRKYINDRKYKSDRKYKNDRKYKDESKYKNKRKYKDNKKKDRNKKGKDRSEEEDDDDHRKEDREYNRY